MRHAEAPLAPWTTLGVGGPAERLILAETERDVIDAVREADEGRRPLTLLGGGSNVLVGDLGLRGDVLRVGHRGVQIERAGDPDLVSLTAAAGTPWDELVERAVHESLAGVECLSGIPGLVGAAPVQNIGAYGQELADTLLAVRAFDRAERSVRTLGRAECELRYRDSAFKRDPSQRFVILGVTLTLRRGAPEAPRYGELSRALDGLPQTAATVRDVVLGLRRAKGMVLDSSDPDTRSAGSFFTNPVVPTRLADEVERIARQADTSAVMPRWEAPGGVKLAAAWLIERAGIARGTRLGRAALSSKHTLALTNPCGDATAAELIALARHVAAAVAARFGVTLRPEVVALGVRDALWAPLG